MMKITPSASASFAPIKTYTKFESSLGEIVDASTRTVVAYEDFLSFPIKPPKNLISVDDLINDLSSEAGFQEALEEGRKWVAESFYKKDGDTIKTLRLRKGWSQSQLAEAIGSSQSHVARIEQGTENIQMSTCRKLCKALGIDMNALNELLERQESLYAKKVPSK